MALLAVLGVHAPGLIWSANQWAENTIAASGAGFPSGNGQIALDNVSAETGCPPSLNPVSGIFSMSLGTNDTGVLSSRMP